MSATTPYDWDDHRADVIRAAERVRLARIKLARVDVNAFCRFVLRDEETNERIQQGAIHETWQGLADKHDRLLIWAAVEHGKTSQLAVGRTLFELGHDPTLRFIVASGTHKMALKIAGQCARYIEHSEELHQVFPNLVPSTDKTAPWRGDALTVQRSTSSRDPSIQVTGVHGNILGSRIDRFVFDDIMTLENTKTASGRDDTYAWAKNVLGRLSRRSRALVTGNVFHVDDTMHRLEKEGSFTCYRFPARGADGAVAWPERWTEEYFARKKVDLGPFEYARLVMCQPRDESESRFKRAWIDLCLARGDGVRQTDALVALPPGYATYTGVDLGARLHDKADLTTLFTILVHPNGDREVLEVKAGRWSGPEIVQLIADVHQRYNSIVLVESNAAQQFVADFVSSGTSVPVKAFDTTGRNKHNVEFGLESLGIELANAKWIIPSRNGKPLSPEVQAWIDEMLFYDPTAHTGDRLMSCWIAREGSRGKGRTVKATVRKLDLLSR